MWSYFKPLRRKASVVTLVLASGLAAMWVRSEARCDLLGIPIAHDTWLYLQSFEHVICFGISSGVDWEFGILESQGADRAQYLKSNRYFTWYEQWPGFGIAGNDNWPKSLQREVDTPYWLIVIPLALLSAYLLLSKPRTDKPKLATKS